MKRTLIEIAIFSIHASDYRQVSDASSRKDQITNFYNDNINTTQQGLSSESNKTENRKYCEQDHAEMVAGFNDDQLLDGGMFICFNEIIK